MSKSDILNALFSAIIFILYPIILQFLLTSQIFSAQPSLPVDTDSLLTYTRWLAINLLNCANIIFREANTIFSIESVSEYLLKHKSCTFVLRKEYHANPRQPDLLYCRNSKLQVYQ